MNACIIHCSEKKRTYLVKYDFDSSIIRTLLFELNNIYLLRNLPQIAVLATYFYFCKIILNYSSNI